MIEEYGGKDATSKFEEDDQHTAESIRDLKKYYIGEYEGKKMTLSERKSESARE